VLIIIFVLVIAIILIFKIIKNAKNQSSGIVNSANPTATAKSPFGTMIAFNISDAVNGLPDKSDALKNGWTEFKKDNSGYQTLLANLQKIIQDRTKLVKTTGFALDRGSFGYFTWNVIEPQKGQFDWDLTDIYIKGAANANVKISAVIQPFASWDQKNTQANANCKMLDAAYYDYKAGAPNDMAEYENFLTKTVERYKDNVAVWEIGNENDAQCGVYQDNPQGYFDLLKISSQTIKKVDPQAKVTNGGASGGPSLGPGADSVGNFWTKFFALGGGQFIDYFNFHYNTERSQNAKLDSATFEKDLNFFNDLMDKNGGKKPLYLTEFGIYSGLPAGEAGTPSEQQNGGGQPIQARSPATNQPGSPPAVSAGQGQDGTQGVEVSRRQPFKIKTFRPQQNKAGKRYLHLRQGKIPGLKAI